MRYDRISKLLDTIKGNMAAQGYYSSSSSVTGCTVKQSQKGIVRTNCIDCLDRTNVVQSAIAKHILLEQLRDLGILRPSEPIDPNSTFEYIFKNMWADHADAISILYSGTGALKTDFTRTGKRSKKGLLQDGMNSIMRYFKNNFLDGSRQDAYDIFLGNYVPGGLQAPIPIKGYSTGHYVFLGIVFLAVLSLFLAIKVTPNFLVTLRMISLILFLLVASITVLLAKYGNELVDLPQLVKLDYIAERENGKRSKKLD
jgi:hypothetical protein